MRAARRPAAPPRESGSGAPASGRDSCGGARELEVDRQPVRALLGQPAQQPVDPLLLRNRSLAAVLVAETVSLTGSAMTFVALPWFVLATTGSTARMGWVLA